MTDEEHKAVAALLGGEPIIIKTERLVRIKTDEPPLYHGTAFYQYVNAQTLEKGELRSEVDAPLSARWNLLREFTR